MNCTRRKMKKPSVAKNRGTVKGKKVSTHPILLKMMYWGIKRTWKGNMRVIIIIAKKMFRNRKSNLAKAKAAMEQDKILAMIPIKEIRKELKRNLPKVYPETPLQPYT